MTSRLVAVPAHSAAAQRAAQSSQSATYVYQPQPQSASVVENVLMTLLNPGVNSQTILVLNSTLAILTLVIALMLWRFDVSGQVRLQLWIFLAVAVSLLLSVNWFMLRYSLSDEEDDSDDEEEEEEEKKEAVKRSKKKEGSSKAAGKEARTATAAAAAAAAAPAAAAARAPVEAEEADEENDSADEAEADSALSRRSAAKKKSRKVVD